MDSWLKLVETTAGLQLRVPPRFSQLLQLLPVQTLCQSELLVPWTKTSSRPGPHNPAAGSEVRTPPTVSIVLHLPPENERWISALPAPRPKTSRRPAPQEVAAGADVRLSPSEEKTAGCGGGAGT